MRRFPELSRETDELATQLATERTIFADLDKPGRQCRLGLFPILATVTPEVVTCVRLMVADEFARSEHPPPCIIFHRIPGRVLLYARSELLVLANAARVRSDVRDRLLQRRHNSCMPEGAHGVEISVSIYIHRLHPDVNSVLISA